MTDNTDSDSSIKYEILPWVYFDVLIDRRTKWGNPFKREEVITKYKEYILTKPELLKHIPLELKDKTLGCHDEPTSYLRDID